MWSNRNHNLQKGKYYFISLRLDLDAVTSQGINILENLVSVIIWIFISYKLMYMDANDKASYTNRNFVYVRIQCVCVCVAGYFRLNIPKDGQFHQATWRLWMVTRWKIVEI